MLPWYVAVGSILVGGFLVAIVVTVSHESEEMCFEREPSYLMAQFRGTKDIVCPDPITVSLEQGRQGIVLLGHHGLAEEQGIVGVISCL